MLVRALQRLASMARHTDEPTMTAWWTREREAEAKDSTADEHESIDAHAHTTAPAPESMATLAASPAALKPPRTPIELWDLVGEDPSPSSEWPTRIAASPDPHAAPDETLVLRAPVAPKPASHVAPLGAPRPRTILPPPSRPAAPTAPAFRPRVMTAPPRPDAWRARSLVACIGGMAFGAAVLAGFFHAHEKVAAPPAPLFAETAAPVAPAPPPTTNAAVLPSLAAPAPVVVADAPPKPKPAAPPIASHATGGVQVSFAVPAPAPEKRKTAKDRELDALLDKLGEEQLKR